MRGTMNGDASLTALQARAVLAAYMIATLLAVGIAISPWRSGYADAADRGPGDVQLYAAEVARIAAGEGYYEAAGQELRARGYPTQSPFNWRTPLPMWLIGRAPFPWFGRAVLIVIAVAATLLAAGAAVDEAGPLRGGALLILLLGAFLPCFVGEMYVMPVVWAAALIALSLAAFSAGWPKLGLAAGLAAPFIRDLAALYVLVMLVLAVVEGRRREALVWCGGLIGFAAFLGWHAYLVSQAAQAGDRAHAEGWIQMGGLPFLLALAQMNCYLLLVPQWVTGVYLPLAVLGLARWSTAGDRRIAATALAYLAAFALVGQEFNQYWGVLLAPLLCLGVVRGPAALGELFRAARLSFGAGARFTTSS